ncbi:zonular occludens toxin domain-containing protein [Acinetobacter bereziniae]|uniref:zonular occludens toxin domain-containing protein n=1 Tax=Acinetobacter bereziniae TaxID=106648 RepID=UPI0030080A66
MSIIISAPLGAGKTLYCMSEIDKISKKDPHKRIYTNIVGCTYPGVILIQSTINKPFDWRDLPNGSILIYDEAHEHPAFSKDDLLKTFQIDDSECIKKIATINIDPDLKVKEKEELVRQERKKQEFKLLKAKEDILDIGRSLTMHRHFGIEIYFITQKPFKLNEAVKASVVEHLILRRLFKLKMATIYTFAELQEQFGRSTMKNALSWRFWTYPKQLYKFYISAETHDQSKKIPLSLYFWILLPVLILGSAIKDSLNMPFFEPILGFFGISQNKDEKPTQQPETANQTAQQNQSNTTEKDIDCNDLNNSHIEKCIAYNKAKADRLNREVQANSAYYINYTPDSPYGTRADIQYTATAKPVFAGCIKFNGKYQAYSQQGTKLNVSQADCKRLIEDGDRPFNYFAQQNQGNYNAQSNNQISNQNLAQYTDKQNLPQKVEQANNYVEPHLEAKVVNGANSL